MSATHTSTITLSALEGKPLAHEQVRDMVLATAHAIAERIGIEVVNLTTTDASITAELRCRRIEAWGFAAELRRLTNAWYAQKFDKDSLWGQPPQNRDDHDWERWKPD